MVGRKTPVWIAVIGWMILSVIGFGGPAYAYRPFDGTDASVADPGEIEMEFGPVGFLKEGGAETIIAPSAVINLGIGEGLRLASPSFATV